MLQPLQIGKLNFPNNLIQGPLAGVSCAPFRELTWRLSKPAYTCTEMISSKTLLYSDQITQKRFLHKSMLEGPVCYQLSGNNAQELTSATKIVTEAGADLIDLNCGCPVKKIRQKNSGSKLLSEATKLYQLIYAMKNATTIPVGIKIRVDGGSTDRFNQEIADAIQDAGIDFLVVHGRHWTENYDINCHYDQIAFFVNALQIPVIGNGDISDITTLQTMYATGCAGVMISRAGVGQPWLLKQLMQEYSARNFVAPTIKTIGNLFLEHTEKLITLLGNEKFAILQARKFAKYYARGLQHRELFVERMNNAIEFKEVIVNVLKYFKVR